MATSMSTQSWNDAASTTPVPNRSHAHLTAADAGSCSSSAETTRELGEIDVDERLALLRWRPGGSCRALAVADLGHVGAGLVEVDVEVGRFLGGGELVEVGEGLADRLGAAGPGEPLRERLAGVALAGERPTTRTTASDARLAGSFVAFLPNAIGMLLTWPPSTIW